jgi:HlyD family secretion protein
LHVKEGDLVRRGQPLAILGGTQQLAAALRHAEAQIAVAQRRLERVRAAPKSGDISEMEAEIARLSAVLESARVESQRYEGLRRTDDVTVAELEVKKTALVNAQHALDAARQRLKSLREVRPADVSLAEAEVESAMADRDRARVDLEASTIHAPDDGRVVRIRAHAGEEAGPEGILELARKGPMYVVAEVYETDIARVRVGSPATISSELLPKPIQGSVARIGMNVARNSVVPGDPVTFSQQRIIEVRVRLNEPGPAANLINGKVSVVIGP